MRVVKVIGLLLLLAVGLTFPLVFSDPTYTNVAIYTLIFAGAATAWNIFSGYTGYISLGHAVFYGIGAYTMTLTCKFWHVPGGYLPFLLLPLAGLVAAICAVPIGWIILRTRQHTFVVITIALLFIFQLLAYNMPGITNGSSGVFLPNPPWSGDFFNTPFYYVAFAVFLLALATSWWIRQSKFGLGLLAIRNDEDRALGLGVKTGQYKLVALVVSAFFAGMAGALTAYFLGIIYPPLAFDPTFDVSVALMTFFGGAGTVAGPILGALLLEPLDQYLTIQFQIGGLSIFIYGGLFLLIVLLLPTGILPSLRALWLRWMASRRDQRESEFDIVDKENALLAEGGGIGSIGGGIGGGGNG